MFKLAWSGIRENYSRALFYGVTFVLTTMFIFIFFNIACSEMVGMTFINSQNNLVTYLSVFVMVICIIVIFFANDFYVKKKSKQMAIRLVCGATFLQITNYLLSSTLFIFMCAVPLGVLLALATMTFLNTYILGMFGINTILGITQEGVYVTIIILAFVVLWCMLLNVGYAYRSSVKSLLTNDITVEEIRLGSPLRLKLKGTKYIYLLMFVLPIPLFYVYGHEPSSIIVLSVFGMIGLYGAWNEIFMPYLNRLVIKHIDNQEKVVYIGFMRRDFVLMKKNLIMFVISTILLIALMVSHLDDSMEVVLCFVSFLVIHCLLSLTVVFRLLVEVLGRKNVFLTLSRIGYEQRLLRSIIKKEVVIFFCILMFVCLIYIGNILQSLYVCRLISFNFVLMVLLIFISPLILCGLIVLFSYKKLI
ncbi:MAG: FtsX-like permease family protein [Coprobacillus sp.]